MILKKNLLNRLQVLLILALLLASCSRATGQSPVPDNTYPSPEVQEPVTYPDPQQATSVESDAPKLNPEIYPAPGKATVFDPLPEDADLVRNDVTIMPDTVQIFLEDAPVVYLRMTVEVIDVCQQVRIVVNAPQDGKINLEVYSVAEKDIACAQVINLVAPTVTLGTLQTGSYELLVNGESAATFEVP